MAEQELVELPLPEEVTRLEEFLKVNVKGQPRGIAAVVKSLQYHYTLRQFERRKGNIGNLLFLGPSGVGKTETARATGEFFTKVLMKLAGTDRSAMIVLNGADYSEPHTISRLIGAPPGYVGFDGNPLLSEEHIHELLGLSSYEGKDSQESGLAALGVPAQLATEISRLAAQDELISHEADTAMKQLERITGQLESYARLVQLAARLGAEFKPGGEENVIKLFALAEMASAHLEMLGDKEFAIQSKIAEVRRKIEELIDERASQDRAAVSGPSKGKDEPPFVVLLIDEVGRASSALHNLLLSIMENGIVDMAHGGAPARLPNGESRSRKSTSNLSNTLIIMTDNAGAESITDFLKGKGIGFSGKADRSKVVYSLNDKLGEEYDRRVYEIATKELLKIFSSAFRGRLDDTVVYRPLSVEVFREILDLELERFNAGLGRYGLTLKLDDDVKDKVIAASTDKPDLGARLLAQKLKSIVKVPLGRRIGKLGVLKGVIYVRLGENKRAVFQHDPDAPIEVKPLDE